MTKRICLLPGDGIGPEVIVEALKVLNAVAVKNGVQFECEEALVGGDAIDVCGEPLPAATLACAKEADAVLLAAVGGPQWESTDPAAPRPEQGLLGLREGLGLYANLRPVQLFDSLRSASPLRSLFAQGVGDDAPATLDLLIVRELTGGLYFGAKGRETDVEGMGTGGAPGRCAFDALDYAEFEIERIVRAAFELARGRKGRLHSVDKANILETSRLWREIVHEIAPEYPDVTFTDMLVDNAAMQLVRDPSQFDVIVTENMFGDILSDEAACLCGSLGMLASASLGSGTALYEPAHGSAPDIAGKGIANPLAEILSVALMLRYSFSMEQAALDIEEAVKAVLAEGWRTPDIACGNTPTNKLVGTGAMGDLVAGHLV